MSDSYERHQGIRMNDSKGQNYVRNKGTVMKKMSVKAKITSPLKCLL